MILWTLRSFKQATSGGQGSDSIKTVNCYVTREKTEGTLYVWCMFTLVKVLHVKS